MKLMGAEDIEPHEQKKSINTELHRFVRLRRMSGNRLRLCQRCGAATRHIKTTERGSEREREREDTVTRLTACERLDLLALHKASEKQTKERLVQMYPHPSLAHRHQI